MSQTIEQELKTLLTKKQLTTIYRDYAFQAPFTQTNTYFELGQRQLVQAQLGLRIRTYATYAEQTLKVPVKQATAHTLIELTDALTLSQAQHLIATTTIAQPSTIATYLNQHHFDLADLIIDGQATTRRALYQLDYGLLTLDETQFSDGTLDYELELETTDLDWATNFLKTFWVTYQITPQKPLNKVQRARQHR